MDTFRISQLELEHRHNDGSWSKLEPSAHDVTETDPERSWLHGRLFRCKECDEQVVVSTGGRAPESEDAPQ